ncbi:hypothetical protein MAR_011689 [Mya arenaria]|uniref:Uncharacterized protein n=1 Tax=Mya arenaria TaxID=6604 RepID=A0ABY7FUW5_MYAAR|nr:hypothetical protein MAR_011689 [Mya arenaria]
MEKENEPQTLELKQTEEALTKERDDKKTIRCLRRDLKRANNTISELQKAKRACAHRQIQPQMTAGFSDSSATASQSLKHMENALNEFGEVLKANMDYFFLFKITRENPHLPSEISTEKISRSISRCMRVPHEIAT